MITAKEICNKLNLNLTEIVNIYPYGSRVYGTNTEISDYDFVIVYKKSLLSSGSFKDNAISSENKLIQGVCYSRSGFIDAINNYQINALECIFLPEEKIILNKMNFSISKYVEKEMVKKIITTASASWHLAKLAYKNNHIESSKKNIYHTIRILDFGIQIKEKRIIFNYSRMNYRKQIIEIDNNFKPKSYLNLFIKLSDTLKNEFS